jgi:hypothetical protein
MGKAGWSGWLWLLVVVWASSALVARAQPETAEAGVGYAPPFFGGVPAPIGSTRPEESIGSTQYG